MLHIDDHSTIGRSFFEAADRHAGLPLLAVPADAARAWHPGGLTLGYAEAAAAVLELMEAYAAAGYGLGHRVALLMDNRPEHLLHKLALNALGICCVPVNPDYRSGELAYLIDHARADLVAVSRERLDLLDTALHETAHQPAAMVVDALPALPQVPLAARAAASWVPQADTPASILYTSGTTGRPKGCVLSHRYELAAGAAYASRGGLVRIGEGCERLYNPLPLCHVNASILSFFCVLLTGNCQVQAERFHPRRFWSEVRGSRATIVHYLGVVIPMLLNQPALPQDLEHTVRFGFGAGVEPQLHAVFERRFGFPLVELWGMTEMVRVLSDHLPTRQAGTRAFGRAMPGLEVKVADEAGRAVPDGQPGEMLIRHSAATPRKDFFSGYLDDEAATEEAWRGGWFHTGDIVTCDAGGTLHFVDRRKNIIRRSGENIAAAEVEALLQAHPRVRQVAVMAVPDEVREEEVLACVVCDELPADDGQRLRIAVELFAHCDAHLAYYKAPGYLWFADSLPTTGTQKLQKHAIFPGVSDPRRLAGMIDLRPLKKRDRELQRDHAAG